MPVVVLPSAGTVAVCTVTVERAGSGRSSVGSLPPPPPPPHPAWRDKVARRRIWAGRGSREDIGSGPFLEVGSGVRPGPATGAGPALRGLAGTGSRACFLLAAGAGTSPLPRRVGLGRVFPRPRPPGPPSRRASRA